MRVHALVDLYFRDDAGGHVKCWQRLAEAACGNEFNDLDLTVHFMADTAGEQDLSERVRYQFHAPRFSTARLPFLGSMPDHTDLARRSRSLERGLNGAELIHASGAEFTFAATGLAESKRRGVPLTLSLHTDTAAYARIFSARAIEGLFGVGTWPARFLTETIGIPRRQQAAMTCKLKTMAAASRHVMAPRLDWPGLDGVATPVTLMRRGIDSARFGGPPRDRVWLKQTYGIHENAVVVAYAGRVNRGKNVGVLIEAVRRALDLGSNVHLILMGEGEDRETAVRTLGDRATCPGVVAQATVGRILASADIMAFPSMVEVFSNTVVEGIASGLPIVLASDSGMHERMDLGDAAIPVPGSAIDAWTQALSGLADDSQQRERRASAARKAASRLPTWVDVLRDDVAAHWRRVYAKAA